MTRDEAKRLAPIIAAYGEGNDIQQGRKSWRDGERWFDADIDDVFMDPHLEYRIAVKKLSFDGWEYLADWVNYLAMDKGGHWYAYSSTPYCQKYCGRWVSAWSERMADILKIDPGDCDWTESLISRPRRESEDDT